PVHTEWAMPNGDSDAQKVRRASERQLLSAAIAHTQAHVELRDEALAALESLTAAMRVEEAARNRSGPGWAWDYVFRGDYFNNADGYGPARAANAIAEALWEASISAEASVVGTSIQVKLYANAAELRTALQALNVRFRHAGLRLTVPERPGCVS